MFPFDNELLRLFVTGGGGGAISCTIDLGSTALWALHLARSYYTIEKIQQVVGERTFEMHLFAHPGLFSSLVLPYSARVANVLGSHFRCHQAALLNCLSSDRIRVVITKFIGFLESLLLFGFYFI